MQENREYVGWWWLPEDPARQVPGELSYDPSKGLFLKLNGIFEEDPNSVPSYYRIVLGKSHRGDPLTLYNCFVTRVGVPSRGYPISTYYIGVAFVGYHFNKPEDIRFSNLTVRFEYLEEWLGFHVFHYEHGLDEKLTITYKKPEPIKMEFDLFDIRINYYLEYTMGDGWREGRMSSQAYLSIDLKNDLSLDDAYYIINHLRNFITLGIGKPIGILEFEGRTRNLEEHKRIEILFQKPQYIGDQPRINPWDMVFPFNSISKNPKYFLDNWLGKVNRLEPIYDLFFATLYIPNLFPVHEFLSLAQTIEAYHSRTFSNNILPVDNFKRLREDIAGKIDKLSKEYRSHFYARLDYMNEKTLRSRLIELLTKYDFLIKGFGYNIEGLANQVVDARNYYTHYSDALKDRAVDIKDLPILAQKLRFILLGILLNEIGFNEEQIIACVYRYKNRSEIRRVI